MPGVRSSGPRPRTEKADGWRRAQVQRKASLGRPGRAADFRWPPLRETRCVASRPPRPPGLLRLSRQAPRQRRLSIGGASGGGGGGASAGGSSPAFPVRAQEPFVRASAPRSVPPRPPEGEGKLRTGALSLAPRGHHARVRAGRGGKGRRGRGWLGRAFAQARPVPARECARAREPREAHVGGSGEGAGSRVPPRQSGPARRASRKGRGPCGGPLCRRKRPLRATRRTPPGRPASAWEKRAVCAPGRERPTP